MKHFNIMALMLAMSLAASAQVLSVGSIEKVVIPAQISVDQAVIAPDGKSLVISTNTDRSLRYVSLDDGQMKTLTDNGSILDLKIADNGTVIYRQSTFNKRHFRFTSIQSVEPATMARQQLVEPSRELGGVAVRGNQVMAVDNLKLKAQALDNKVVEEVPVASIHRGQLMITRDGVTTAINPNGKHGQSYLWPSVSPDGTKVLYYLATMGCWICDIDGSNPQRIGVIRAPRWIDNSTIVGMRDEDDGQFYTASTVVAATLDGITQDLTPADMIAMFPTPSADGSKIAFSTPAGEVYIININR
ncbi:MAG: hypothetical protein LIP02_05065 [Bacteroidales bacterium]|nr:hypothetical protein [Bacteroidales bacterium]